MSEQPSNAAFLRRQRAEIVQSVCRLLEDKYVFPDIAERATAEVLSRMQSEAYELPEADFAEAITQDLQKVTDDSHLRIVYDPKRVAQLRNEGKQAGRSGPSEMARSRNLWIRAR